MRSSWGSLSSLFICSRISEWRRRPQSETLKNKSKNDFTRFADKDVDVSKYHRQMRKCPSNTFLLKHHTLFHILDWRKTNPGTQTFISVWAWRHHVSSWNGTVLLSGIFVICFLPRNNTFRWSAEPGRAIFVFMGFLCDSAHRTVLTERKRGRGRERERERDGGHCENQTKPSGYWQTCSHNPSL